MALNDVTIERLIREWQASPSSTETDRQASSLDRPTSATAANVKSSSGPAPNGTATDASRDAKETFENDAELVTKFRKLVAEKLARGLHVNCEGQLLAIREIKQELPAAYHMSVTVQFEFTLPTDKVTDLQISDDNFTRFDGCARYALKAVGNAVLTRSNVAPILVRAKRIEFADLSEEARRESCFINAQIVQAQKPQPAR